MSKITAARITAHARIAMARRSITEAAVWQVLRAPEAVIEGNRAGRQVFQAVAVIGDPAQRVLLRVVVDSAQDPPAVITAYATTSFNRYGANP